jgi:hypothetical protein
LHNSGTNNTILSLWFAEEFGAAHVSNVLPPILNRSGNCRAELVFDELHQMSVGVSARYYQSLKRIKDSKAL